MSLEEHDSLLFRIKNIYVPLQTLANVLIVVSCTLSQFLGWMPMVPDISMSKRYDLLGYDCAYPLLLLHLLLVEACGHLPPWLAMLDGACIFCLLVMSLAPDFRLDASIGHLLSTHIGPVTFPALVGSLLALDLTLLGWRGIGFVHRLCVVTRPDEPATTAALSLFSASEQLETCTPEKSLEVSHPSLGSGTTPNAAIIANDSSTLVSDSTACALELADDPSHQPLRDAPALVSVDAEKVTENQLVGHEQERSAVDETPTTDKSREEASKGVPFSVVDVPSALSSEPAPALSYTTVSSRSPPTTTASVRRQGLASRESGSPRPSPPSPHGVRRIRASPAAWESPVLSTPATDPEVWAPDNRHTPISALRQSRPVDHGSSTVSVGPSTPPAKSGIGGGDVGGSGGVCSSGSCGGSLTSSMSSASILHKKAKDVVVVNLASLLLTIVPTVAVDLAANQRSAFDSEQLLAMFHCHASALQVRHAIDSVVHCVCTIVDNYITKDAMPASALAVVVVVRPQPESPPSSSSQPHTKPQPQPHIYWLTLSEDCPPYVEASAQGTVLFPSAHRVRAFQDNALASRKAVGETLHRLADALIVRELFRVISSLDVGARTGCGSRDPFAEIIAVTRAVRELAPRLSDMTFLTSANAWPFMDSQDRASSDRRERWARFRKQQERVAFHFVAIGQAPAEREGWPSPSPTGRERACNPTGAASGYVEGLLG